MKSFIFSIALFLVSFTAQSQTMEATAMTVLTNAGLEEYQLKSPAKIQLDGEVLTIETGKIVRVYQVVSIRNLDRFTTELVTSTGVRVEVIFYRAEIDQVVIYTPFEVIRYFEPTWKQN